MASKLIEDVRQRYPTAIETRFGDSPALSATLIDLIRSGQKTATVSALHFYEDDGDPLPETGQLQLILSFDGEPELIVEITECTIRPFSAVDWDFAKLEGENDDLAGWQADHRAYFERNGGFDPAMLLVCEQFRIVEDLRRKASKSPKQTK